MSAFCYGAATMHDSVANTTDWHFLLRGVYISKKSSNFCFDQSDSTANRYVRVNYRFWNI